MKEVKDCEICNKPATIVVIVEEILEKSYYYVCDSLYCFEKVKETYVK